MCLLSLDSHKQGVHKGVWSMKKRWTSRVKSTERNVITPYESSSDSVLHEDSSQVSTDGSEHMEQEAGARVLPPLVGWVILRTCLVCGDIVSSGLVLEQHMKSLHPLHKPYDCDKCGAVFNNRWELSNHQANLHRWKKVSCKHCVYSSVSKSRMHLHVWIHTRGMKRSMCENKFPSLSAKLAHERLHHGSCIPLDCDLCDKSYSTVMAHRIHMCGKHGEGYQCSWCGKCFDTLTQQSRHLRVCHSDSMNTEDWVCLLVLTALLEAWWKFLQITFGPAFPCKRSVVFLLFDVDKVVVISFFLDVWTYALLLLTWGFFPDFCVRSDRDLGEGALRLLT